MPMDIPEYQLPDPHEGNSPTLEQTDVVDTEQLANAIHIHPALSEVLQRACAGIEWE